MEFRLSQNAENILKNSRGEAIRLNSDCIEVEHILLSILRLKQCKAFAFLSRYCDCEALKSQIENALREFGNDFDLKTEKDDITLSEEAEKVIKISHLESLKSRKKEVDSEDLLAAILFCKESLSAKLLQAENIDYKLFESQSDKAELSFNILSSDISTKESKPFGISLNIQSDPSFNTDKENKN